MSDTMSSSVSAAAIFSAEDGGGRAPNIHDMSLIVLTDKPEGVVDESFEVGVM